MNKRHQLVTMAAFLFLSGGSAWASDENEISFAKEVNACLTEVNDQADYNNATRVRHTVVELKNTFAGYVLSIDTDVFTESDEVAVREYSSYCVAKGDSKPKKFRISELTS